MQHPIPALILAGGASSRMGSDKSLVTLDGQRLIDRVVAKLQSQTTKIVINSQSAISGLGDLTMLPDVTGAQYGPLSGILTGMSHFTGVKDVTHFLSVSVDCPFLPDDLIERLSQHVQQGNEIAIASSGQRHHPTIGLWPVALRDQLTTWLTSTPNYSINAFLDLCRVKRASFPMVEMDIGEIDPFFNINRPEDLVLAESYLASLR
jgi:molybdopterin-guanine dinucleotide biosynthesis protein A